MSHHTLRGRMATIAAMVAVAAIAVTGCQDDKSDASGAPSSAPSSAGSEGSEGSEGSADSAGSSGSGAGSGTDANGTHGTDASKGSGSGTGTGSSSGDASRCTAASMSLRLGRGDAGAGNLRYPLVFTNTGQRTCTLRGYPGVSLLARDGQSIGRPATREGDAGKAVTLKPGASAYSVLHTVNEGISDKPCWKAADLVQTYPPGSKESMTTRASGLRACGDEFTTTAVAPGTGV